MNSREQQITGNRHTHGLTPLVVTPTIAMGMLSCGRTRLYELINANEIESFCDGYAQKAIHCDTPSGRRATWPTLDLLIIALFGRDFRIKIEAGADMPVALSKEESDINSRYRVSRHWRYRKHYADLGRKGAAAY